MNEAMIAALAVIFVCKIFDCAFNTLKTILLCKDKYFLSATCAAISVVFFVFTVQQGGLEAYIAIGVATFFGNYLPPKVVEKLSSDKMFIYEITSDTLERGISFADRLRELNIPLSTDTVYDKNMNKVLVCKVYSSSKAISRMIMDNKPPEFNFNAYTPIYT